MNRCLITTVLPFIRGSIPPTLPKPCLNPATPPRTAPFTCDPVPWAGVRHHVQALAGDQRAHILKSSLNFAPYISQRTDLSELFAILVAKISCSCQTDGARKRADRPGTNSPSSLFLLFNYS